MLNSNKVKNSLLNKNLDALQLMQHKAQVLYTPLPTQPAKKKKKSPGQLTAETFEHQLLSYDTMFLMTAYESSIKSQVA